VAIYYFDTNALVKLYVFDKTSYWAIGVEAQRKPRHQIFTSEIVRVEVPSALYKIGRIDPNVDASAIDLSLRRFKRQVSAETEYRNSRFLVVLLNGAILIQADALLTKYRGGRPKALHSLDALHLASAIVARSTLHESARDTMLFVSVDKQLRGCAQSEGFTVIDPSAPPSV
jgi:predicted nucleic acid-binding protein